MTEGKLVISITSDGIKLADGIPVETTTDEDSE